MLRLRARSVHPAGPTRGRPSLGARCGRKACRALPRDGDRAPLDNTVQEIITILTAEGTIHRIPGRRLSLDWDSPDGPLLGPGGGAAGPRGARRTRQQPMPTWEEQAICIGATFAVSATNGRDPTRRVHFLGFCQSLDYLQEAVEDTVLSRGGEVLLQERQLRGGLHEALRLTVAIPFLWGVPPEVDALSDAILQGGGILDKVQKQWDIYGGPAAPGALTGPPYPGVPFL